jgi:hypothetical protein
LYCKTGKEFTPELFFQPKWIARKVMVKKRERHFVQEDIRYIEGTAGRFYCKRYHRKAKG